MWRSAPGSETKSNRSGPLGHGLADKTGHVAESAPQATYRRKTQADLTAGRGEEKKRQNMSEGKIKRLTDKGFGFIETNDGNQDMFFHMSSCNGVAFDDLNEGQAVLFDEGHGPKGPRAENVRLA